MTQLPLYGAAATVVGDHRYTLCRWWGDGPRIVWCMLNPSTADEDANDATIRRCITFSQRWGFDGMEVINLFSWRATDPRDLQANLTRAVDTRTDDAIRATAADVPTVVVAWERYAGRRWLEERATKVLSLLHLAGASLECLGRNADDSPKHPLFVPYARKREPFPMVCGNGVSP